jgi:lactoylglutathione lyase
MSETEGAVATAVGGNVRQAVPFFGVTDMAASLRFYVDGLGFEVKIRWEPEGTLRWCWMERGGAALMLQEYTPDRRPEGALGVGVSICFICDDAIAIHHEAKSRGLDASRPFVGNGMWVTSLTDPDGYRVDFESTTDVPEGTEYADPAGGAS